MTYLSTVFVIFYSLLSSVQNVIPCSKSDLKKQILAIEGGDRLKLKDKMVGLLVHFADVHSLDEKFASSIKMLAFLELTWKIEDIGLNCTLKKILTFDAEKTKVWKPQFLITAVRNARIVSSPYSMNVIYAYSDGQFSWLMGMELELGCEMDFMLFPFDQMYCMFYFQTKDADNDYELYWTDFDHQTPLWTFRSHWINKIKASYFNVTTQLRSTTVVQTYPIGEVYFKRYIAYYALSVFAPVVLITTVPWFGFLMDPASAPARVSLGVSSLVALILQYGNINKSIPKVGYVMLIDVWLLLCALFIIFSLMEYAIICYIKTGPRKRTCAKIDRISSILYPAALISVTVAYFTMSLAWDSITQKEILQD